MTDWKIFRGEGSQHDGLLNLPLPPPWRFSGAASPIQPMPGPDISEERRAEAFLPSQAMVAAVNAALYLRRPLLLTGKPGSGKSTLIAKVAHELKLGPVLRWPINSRATVRGGVYEYDAVGRLQAGRTQEPAVEDYLVLGPLGTALHATGRPRALLVDEIDKSDLDFANDLLNVIEEGEYEIPELRRLSAADARVRNFDGEMTTVHAGRLRGDHFPFVVMTSNAEREFPPAFLRRCIRLHVELPNEEELQKIVSSQLKAYVSDFDAGDLDAVFAAFRDSRGKGDVSTDQLLNAVYLTVAMQGAEKFTFAREELESLRERLLAHISGPEQ
jgi:MoxR-like ATPase